MGEGGGGEREGRRYVNRRDRGRRKGRDVERRGRDQVWKNVVGTGKNAAVADQRRSFGG